MRRRRLLLWRLLLLLLLLLQQLLRLLQLRLLLQLLRLLYLHGRVPSRRPAPRRSCSHAAPHHKCVPQGVLAMEGIPPAVAVGCWLAALGAGETLLAVLAAVLLVILLLDAGVDTLQG